MQFGGGKRSWKEKFLLISALPILDVDLAAYLLLCRNVQGKNASLSKWEPHWRKKKDDWAADTRCGGWILIWALSVLWILCMSYKVKNTSYCWSNAWRYDLCLLVTGFFSSLHVPSSVSYLKKKKATTQFIT